MRGLLTVLLDVDESVDSTKETIQHVKEADLVIRLRADKSIEFVKSRFTPTGVFAPKWLGVLVGAAERKAPKADTLSVVRIDHDLMFLIDTAERIRRMLRDGQQLLSVSQVEHLKSACEAFGETADNWVKWIKSNV